jgi:hypothetical protein
VRKGVSRNGIREGLAKIGQDVLSKVIAQFLFLGIIAFLGFIAFAGNGSLDIETLFKTVCFCLFVSVSGGFYLLMKQRKCIGDLNALHGTIRQLLRDEGDISRELEQL